VAFKGPTSNGKERKGRRRKRGEGGDWGTEGRGPHIQPPPLASQNLGLALVLTSLSITVSEILSL